MRFNIQKIINSLTQALLLSVLCLGFLATQVMAKGGKLVFIPIAVGDISTFIPLLPSPSQVSISTQENTLGDIHNVSWEAVDGAAYYQIEVIDSEGKKQVFITTELNYALSGLPLGESSAYILACNNKNQCGSSSSLGSYLTTEKIRFVHADLLGSPVLETDEAGNVLAEFHYKPYGETKEEKQEDVGYTGHLEDVDLGLTYMQARYYDPVVGRFYSDDPVGFRSIHSFNRYTYANNNPYRYVDPDGESAVGALTVIAATDAATPDPSDVAAVPKAAGYVAAFAIAVIADAVVDHFNESSDSSGSTPDLPDKLVGDQSDDRAGPNKNGKRHTSGPLTPENGGTGDYDADLEILTGGTREAGKGDSAPPGAQIGENGIFGRPTNSSGGKSIDIPANGDKPHETLHYD